ncbi:MAG: adaptor protein MecA [Peptococcaceae bacterium]|nr:adaptor protein MecA [Peptococcaceae bacterium]
MKINLINDDQLQIIVTKKDMFGRDMRTLFRDIIEQARLQFGFEVVHNTSLMVEAYPLSEESMILTITKINSEDINFDLITSEDIADEPWAVFEFQSLDDVIELAHLIGSVEECESDLFKYDERYGLYIQDVNCIEENSRGHFVEYGEISQMTREFLNEHGTLLIRENALTTLSKI